MATLRVFTKAKLHIIEKKFFHLSELKTGQVLSPVLTKLGMNLNSEAWVVLVFRYNTGVVPWSEIELEQISKLRISAFKQALSFSSNMDGSPIVWNCNDGGKECPLAVEEWTRAVLDLWDTCIFLPGVPGEISWIVTHNLRQSCLDHGCNALNQLQCLLRISDKAESTTLRLLCLDEQGLVVSSPWLPSEETSIAEVLWTQVTAIWRKSRSSLDVESWRRRLTKWGKTKYCLSECKELGQARIMMQNQLRNCAGTWCPRDELRHQNCTLTADEYVAVVLGLNSAGDYNVEPAGEQHDPTSALYQAFSPIPLLCIVCFGVLPPCIYGRVVAGLEQDQVDVESVPTSGVPPKQLISATSNETLIWHLCNTRTVFSVTADGSRYLQVECLVPVQSAISAAHCPDSAVVGVFQQGHTFTRAG
jgi:hypothetical protein